MNLRLLNKYEEITYNKLSGVCNGRARVFAKVRLADVFPIKNSGITSEEFSYALKSHFDFLVFNENYEPLFAVEYDGKQHYSDPTQVRNDLLKNGLCERFKFPILRANFNYVSREFKGLDLLTYFVDCWFLCNEFYDAQEKGYIPYEEDFDPCFLVSNGDGSNFPYWISLESQLDIQSCYKQKNIIQQAPSDWVGVDKDGNYRCITWLELNSNEVIYLTTGMRGQLFNFLSISELIRMINIVDLNQALKAYFSGSFKSVSTDEFKQKLEAFCGRYEPRGSATAGHIVAPFSITKPSR
ncbi:DUF2726 domain-containing protein [Photobacterium chitinilyticum]|uniref:DUF2726 domain-containing protein n=1 Tax=Photobacterium chitinilyticum TaxID=2485123 RepID=UPI003D0BE2EA